MKNYYLNEFNAAMVDLEQHLEELLDGVHSLNDGSLKKAVDTFESNLYRMRSSFLVNFNSGVHLTERHVFEGLDLEPKETTPSKEAAKTILPGVVSAVVLTAPVTTTSFLFFHTTATLATVAAGTVGLPVTAVVGGAIAVPMLISYGFRSRSKKKQLEQQKDLIRKQFRETIVPNLQEWAEERLDESFSTLYVQGE